MYSPYTRVSTSAGVGYVAPGEWDMCLVYKWLVQLGYSEIGIQAILGNIARESVGGHTWAWESGYNYQTTYTCGAFPRMDIDYSSSTYEATIVDNATTFTYWQGMLAYSERVDSLVFDRSTWISTTSSNGYGLMQWTSSDLRALFWDATIGAGVSTRRADKQAQVIEDTLKFDQNTTITTSSPWYRINGRTDTYKPYDLLHSGEITAELLGNYCWSGSEYEQYYNVNYPERALTAYFTQWVESPVWAFPGGGSSATDNYYGMERSYWLGVRWLNYCKTYADAYDYDKLAPVVQHMPIWMYPSVRRGRMYGFNAKR